MAYAHQVNRPLDFSNPRDALINTLRALHISVTDPQYAPQSVANLRYFAEGLIEDGVWNTVELERLLQDDCQDWFKLMGALRRSRLQEFSKEELGLG